MRGLIPNSGAKQTSNESDMQREFTHEFFDDASKVWRANKKVGPNLTFKYVCQGEYKNGRACKRPATFNFGETISCRQHQK
jgi:hypothetical protein